MEDGGKVREARGEQGAGARSHRLDERIAAQKVLQAPRERHGRGVAQGESAMNAATTSAADHTLLPTTRPAWLNQTVSRASAPAPERKNIP